MSAVQREQRLGGLGGSALVNMGVLAGWGKMKVSEQNRGRHVTVQQGRDKLGLAEGHGAGSSRKRGAWKLLGC